jgi:hypothetical protein
MYEKGYIESILNMSLPGKSVCPSCKRKVSTLFAKSNDKLEIVYVCYECCNPKLRRIDVTK